MIETIFLNQFLTFDSEWRRVLLVENPLSSSRPKV